MKKHRNPDLIDVDITLDQVRGAVLSILNELDKPTLTRRDVSRLKSLQKKLSAATMSYDEWRLIIANRLVKKRKDTSSFMAVGKENDNND